MLLTFVAHVVALFALVALALRGQDVDWSALFPRDADDEDGGLRVGGATAPPEDPDGGRSLELPLPDAGPAGRRLRGPGPRRAWARLRRGGRHEPQREPAGPRALR